MNTEEYINKLFLESGWYEGREVKIKKSLTEGRNAAHENANAILAQYGGLKVGKVGVGRELSASDILFKYEAIDFGSKFRNWWPSLSTSLFCFCICSL
ncbi:hypothetical protein EYS14_05370 [Alteromonadaceae bacterium M269]|nr:hypothetical protein EYS14_05370 [Alteromonadaceae bacterium M269]